VLPTSLPLSPGPAAFVLSSHQNGRAGASADGINFGYVAGRRRPRLRARRVPPKSEFPVGDGEGGNRVETETAGRGREERDRPAEGGPETGEARAGADPV